MPRTLIFQTPQKIGEEVTLQGWVNARRDHGKIIFIDLRDRTGLVQVVIPMALAEKIGPEWVVEIQGIVKERPQNLINPKIETGTIEVEAKNINIISESLPTFPIALNEKGDNESDQQLRLDWRFLDLRKPEKRSIFEVWTAMEQAFRNYWTTNNYIEIHSPKFMGAPSESGAELFEVNYFERKAYLAQSPQFYKQMAMAAGFERVFEVGPVFRANPSFTSRHDTEFTMYDLELSFIESHEEVMKEEEKTLAFVLEELNKKYGPKILESYGRKLQVPKVPFPRLTMKQAKEILTKLQVPREKEGDLNPEEERRIGAYIKEQTGSEFVFITEYPIEERPFYHMRLESNPKLTKSFDLLWEGLEITTGAQREHRLEILKSQALEKGLSLESIKFYLDFFKYGCPPHGGCALGPSRMLMKIFNIPNVREVTYLYRGVNRLNP